MSIHMYACGLFCRLDEKPEEVRRGVTLLYVKRFPLLASLGVCLSENVPEWLIFKFMLHLAE